MSFPNPRRRTPVTGLRSEGENVLPLKGSMTLRKGATFHSPTTSSNDSFVPPSLPRSQTHMDDVVNANRRRIALTLNDIDEALAMTRDLSLSPKSPTNKSLHDDSLPVPRGFLDLPVVDLAMAKDNDTTERRVLRPRSARHSRNQASDSGLGSSLSSVKRKGGAGDASARKTKSTVNATAITRSAALANMEQVPALGQKAANRIQEHTLGPLLEAKRLKDFHPLVLEIPRRIRSKEIVCLRDLEKTLVFMAPEKAKSVSLYLDFCITSIQCIQATVEYVTEREQIRPGDRPYTNGYFIDLKEQILEYARELAVAKDQGGMDDMSVDQPDEVQLYGGIAENGRPAELVRISKDGTAISLATGKPVDMGDHPTIKRSLSEQRDDEEEIMRSMARRKKNPTPEELAPKRCREPGCTKEFKRPCDLTKHEKTHSRPWKCPIPTCKYHEFGWPTEKEMGRHLNDKHSNAPAMYECLFKPCPYKSKRESNCKQHMEKAHGWTYVRTKTPANKQLPSMPGSVQQQTPPLGNVSTPSTTPAYSVPTPPQDNFGPVASTDFPTYAPHEDWMAQFNLRSDWDTDLLMDNTSPSSANSYEHVPSYQNGSAFILNDEDIYAARAHIQHQPLNPDQLAAFNMKLMPQQPPMQSYQAPVCPPMNNNAPHFSPSGQQNAMLFTPNSLRDVDEAFDDSFATGDGDDFLLYQSNVSLNKTNEMSLFPDMPSADMGLSQQTQPDMFQHMDWNVNFNGLQE